MIHAGGAGPTPSSSSTAKVNKAHRSAGVLRQPDSAACQKAKDEVTWDLVQYAGAVGALLATTLTVETGIGLLGVAAAWAALAKAQHDLKRDQAVVNDPEGPCGPADDRGDPHIRTYDHLRYSPQAVGEFVMSTTGSDGETIQVRQQPFGTSRDISVVTGVAANVAGARVDIVSTETGATVRIDGVDIAVDADGTDLPKGGRIVAVEPDDLRLVWPSGTILRALLQTRRMAVSVQLVTSLAGTTTGLLGNADGDTANDLVTRTGTPITSATDRTQLYEVFMESWRITDAESLFTYEAGQSTATFTDRTFPDQHRDVSDLTAEQRANAEKVRGRRDHRARRARGMSVRRRVLRRSVVRLRLGGQPRDQQRHVEQRTTEGRPDVGQDLQPRRLGGVPVRSDRWRGPLLPSRPVVRGQQAGVARRRLDGPSVERKPVPVRRRGPGRIPEGRPIPGDRGELPGLDG